MPSRIDVVAEAAAVLVILATLDDRSLDQDACRSAQRHPCSGAGNRVNADGVSSESAERAAGENTDHRTAFDR